MTQFEVCGTPGAIEPKLYIRTEAKLDQLLCEQALDSLAKMGAALAPAKR